MNILIIEADQLLAKNLYVGLRRAGHKVTRKTDAQAAITAADACTPDVIILDLLLANRSGIEFLYELRSYPDWKDIPVIIYSSVRPSELPAGFLKEFGITKTFYKPLVKLADLADEVQRLAAVTS